MVARHMTCDKCGLQEVPVNHECANWTRRAQDRKEAMTIDTKRLEAEAAYWDELKAPDDANFCVVPMPHNTDNKMFFARTFEDGGLSFEGIDCGGEEYSPSKKHWFMPIPRPTKPAAPEWDGEGLPPVGRECEVHMHGDQWSKARVVGHDEEGGIPSAVCRVLDSYYAFSKKCVRPLRTKEQRQRDELVDFVATASGIRARDGRGAIALDIADAILARYSLEPKDD